MKAIQTATVSTISAPVAQLKKTKGKCLGVKDFAREMASEITSATRQPYSKNNAMRELAQAFIAFRMETR